MQKPKLTIITGASRGLGRAIAERYTKQQLPVLVTARNLTALTALKTEDPELIDIITTDLANLDTAALIRKIPKETTVDIIHCAATPAPKLLSEISASQLDSTLRINLLSPVLLTQQLMQHCKVERVLFISSGLAHHPQPGLGAYCISKAALNMAWQVLNSEQPNHNTLFASLLPGVFDTEMQKQLRNTPKNDLPCVEMFEQFHQEQKLRPAEEVANYVFDVMKNSSDEAFFSTEWNINS